MSESDSSRTVPEARAGSVTSRDGTEIHFDRVGEGPAVILVGGAMQFRGFDPTTSAMAVQLAARGYTVINHDRRGRGDSAGAESFTLLDEIDDLAALIAEAGGEAALYGGSSGGAICLAAAAAGLSVTKLALWEVPLQPDGGAESIEFAEGFRASVAAAREAGAASGAADFGSVIEYYMKDMPTEWLAGAKASPGWPVMTGLAPSLQADAEALAWAQSAPRDSLWSGVTVPALVLVGASTLPVMTDAAASLERSLPDARVEVIDAANHQWRPEVMVEALAAFL